MAVRLLHPSDVNGKIEPAGKVVSMNPRMEEMYVKSGAGVQVTGEEVAEAKSEAEVPVEETTGEEVAEESSPEPQKPQSFGRPGRKAKAT